MNLNAPLTLDLLRQAQARWQVWEAAHPRELEDEFTRLAQINEPFWMERLAPHVRAHLLRLRLDEAEREERARAILEDERRGGGE